MTDSEYIVQRESLESIADEIRVLSGATDLLGLDEMATHVSDANTDVETMAGLIEELETALEGKSVEGGGKTEIETVSMKMQFEAGIPASIEYTTLDDNANFVSVCEPLNHNDVILCVVGTPIIAFFSTANYVNLSMQWRQDDGGIANGGYNPLWESAYAIAYTVSAQSVGLLYANVGGSG